MADGSDLSDFDPIAGAVSLAQSAGDGSMVRPYDPTWRDRIGSFLIGDQKPTPERRDFVSGLVGSTGLGETGMSASDMTPAGVALGLQQAAQHHDPVGMALNLAAVLPIGKAVKAADAMAPEVGNAMRGIIAYHGSPHSFDKFDLSKIGTGEGAQAYGHGLYFAESEPVAKSYKDALSGGGLDVYLNGEKQAMNLGHDQREIYNAAQSLPGDAQPWVKSSVLNSLRNQHLYGDTPLTRDEFIDKTFKQAVGPNPPFGPENLAKIRQSISDTVDAMGNVEFKRPGSMYQVRINADPAHFLDWDKPLSEQGANVQSALKNVGIEGKLPEYYHDMPLQNGARLQVWDDPDFGRKYAMVMPNGGGRFMLTRTEVENLSGAAGQEYTGKGVVSKLSGEGGSATSATDQLRQAGIPGIKYLDAGSRGAGEGSRNYVVFNPDMIDILRRYAFGGSIADDAMRIASSVRPGGHDNEL